VYAFYYSLQQAEAVKDQDRLFYIFSAFPWRGGYSAVNFYNSLNSQIPVRLRPNVRSIQYASPGWIELSLAAVPAALAIGQAIDCFIKKNNDLNDLYQHIYKGFHERKLMQIDLKRKEMELSKEQVDFALDMSKKLSESLGFEHLEELHERTGHPLATLKMLLSYFRRIRSLAEYTVAGKAYFPKDKEPPQLHQ
jgi:hypothetical protein